MNLSFSLSVCVSFTHNSEACRCHAPSAHPSSPLSLHLYEHLWVFRVRKYQKLQTACLYRIIFVSPSTSKTQAASYTLSLSHTLAAAPLFPNTCIFCLMCETCAASMCSLLRLPWTCVCARACTACLCAYQHPCMRMRRAASKSMIHIFHLGRVELKHVEPCVGIMWGKLSPKLADSSSEGLRSTIWGLSG